MSFTIYYWSEDLVFKNIAQVGRREYSNPSPILNFKIGDGYIRASKNRMGVALYSFLSGKPIYSKNAVASSLLSAVVTIVIAIPKTSLISSSEVSGNMTCSLSPME